MKILLFLLILISASILCRAQKPTLDYKTGGDWPSPFFNGSKISNDGNYILYNVCPSNLTKGSVITLTIQSTKGTLKNNIRGVRDGSAFFVGNDTKVLYMMKGDTLGICSLPNGAQSIIPGVLSFKTSITGKWTAYLKSNKELVLSNMTSDTEMHYTNVIDYFFSKTGRKLVLKTIPGNDKESLNSLKLVNCYDGTVQSIWQGYNLDNFVFDKSENKLLFTAEASGNSSASSCDILVQSGIDSARVLISHVFNLNKERFDISPVTPSFSQDGSRIFFFYHRKRQPVHLDPKAAKVDVWSYKDEVVQSRQLLDTSKVGHFSYLAIINLSDKKIIRLEQDSVADWLAHPILNEGMDDNFLLMMKHVSKKNEFNHEALLDLVDTKSGQRAILKKLPSEYFYFGFSPAGKFVAFYAPEKRAFFTYNIVNKEIINVTAKITKPVYMEDWDEKAPPISYASNHLLWLNDDQGILVYDRFDIWLVDPNGKKRPVNLTNGFGRKNNIQLRPVLETYENGSYPSIAKCDSLIISGFGETTKRNCFFKISLRNHGNLRLLSDFSDLIYFDRPGFMSDSHFIKKAAKANVYLLIRQGASQYPNLVTTNNFKKFDYVTNFQPQDKYNWLTSELLTWKTFTGRQAHGILYKPENFISSQKYPIIFCVYEQMSDGLNKFIKPGLSIGPMNIPWFVSHGYLVFCPDIFYKVGQPGASAYDYIVSAANMLMKKPFVNSKRMGIQGHSFGGFEVNYIITRTKLFAAAVSSSGLSDWISDYGSIGWGADLEDFIENWQPRLGNKLWKAKSNYIANSPVMYADQVHTPLLIMQNKGDVVVPWAQGVEFFLALRRIQKKAWMLQYDDGNHVLTSDASKLDYSIRLGQFFDHYLKGEPAPKWMVEGIPASMKQIDNGLELEPGREP